MQTHKKKRDQSEIENHISHCDFFDPSVIAQKCLQVKMVEITGNEERIVTRTYDQIQHAIERTLLCKKV